MKLSILPGLYIHVPFCRSKCDYCSFYSIPASGNDSIIISYIDRAIAELAEVKELYGSIEFDTLYLGGGTPSVLPEKQLNRLLDYIFSFFTINGDAEITLEMNPDDISRSKLDSIVKAGVNRIVLGVQSVSVKNRNILGRRGRNPGAEDLDLFFSCSGITHCLDFIGGIPEQEPADLEPDLDVIRRWKPDHISYYMLSVEENTPLSGRFKPGDEFNDIQARSWAYIIQELKDSGYHHYEISNFCIPGSESVHNMKYWRFVPYIGIGPGAHSFYNNMRYANPASVEQYLMPGAFTRNHDVRGEKELLIEFIMTSLRILDGFDLADYKRISNCELPDLICKRIEHQISRGLVSRNGNLISLTEKGVFLCDRVIYDIIEPYL